jgi:uridine phosphorylase
VRRPGGPRIAHDRRPRRFFWLEAPHLTGVHVKPSRTSCDAAGLGAADEGGWPLLAGKAYAQDSVFRPENLLREARRQRHLPEVAVPRVCLLDPDGDIARYLAGPGNGRRHPGWACYHTDMWVTGVPSGDRTQPPAEIGVVGNAVGAPFAVLVAEQLHASGASLVISITSAGQLTPLARPPYFVLIVAALRDEGTSTHYLPPARWAPAPGRLLTTVTAALRALPDRMIPGRSWTTDAPFRETPAAIRRARDAGADCVEMESAALYAYAAARDRDVLCLAHVTNTMAVDGDDFEKGHANGALAAIRMTEAIAQVVQAGLQAP